MRLPGFSTVFSVGYSTTTSQVSLIRQNPLGSCTDVFLFDGFMVVGAWVPCRLEITENHPAYGHLAVYCKRYWGSEKEKPRDYGDSVCPKADAFIIEEHREQWRLQSQNAPLTTNSDRENDVNENEGRDMGIHEDKNISLNKTPFRVDERHPVLIRKDAKEYLLLYDKMKSLHQSRHIAVLAGQPGIGNLHPCPPLHLRS
jgi:hypothetical protein